MRCHRCQAEIEPEEVREQNGLTCCEDCYLDAVSTVKTCDPWAVHLAKSEMGRSGLQLTPRQQKFYDLVKAKEDLTFQEAARLMGLSEEELRREFATLRHLELLRAHKPHKDILITLF